MTTTINPAEPVLGDQPSDWPELSPEVLAIARERDHNGLLTARAQRMRAVIEDTRWYLVKNVHGWKSGRSGRVEPYFTVAGIEKPCRGPWGVFATFQQITQDDDLARSLTMEAHRIGQLEPISLSHAQRLYDRIRARVGPHQNIGPRPGNLAERR